MEPYENKTAKKDFEKLLKEKAQASGDAFEFLNKFRMALSGISVALKKNDVRVVLDKLHTAINDPKSREVMKMLVPPNHRLGTNFNNFCFSEKLKKTILNDKNHIVHSIFFCFLFI